SLDQMDLSKAESLLQDKEGWYGMPAATDVMTAVAYLGRVLRRSPGNKVAAARLFDTLCRRSLPLPLESIQTAAPLHFMTFSEDGRWLATVSGCVAQVWNPTSAEPVCPTLQHPNQVFEAVFTKNSERLVTIEGESPDPAIDVRALRTGAPEKLSAVRV